MIPLICSVTCWSDRVLIPVHGEHCAGSIARISCVTCCCGVRCARSAPDSGSARLRSTSGRAPRHLATAALRLPAHTRLQWPRTDQPSVRLFSFYLHSVLQASVILFLCRYLCIFFKFQSHLSVSLNCHKRVKYLTCWLLIIWIGLKPHVNITKVNFHILVWWIRR